MIRLENMDWLWLNLAILPLWILFFYFVYWRKRSVKKLASVKMRHIVLPNFSTRKPWVTVFLYSAAIICFSLAMANPQIGNKIEEVKREGIEIMVCLDVSNSMLAEDVAPNRLESSKRIIAKLADQLEGDKLGMVVFAGQAFVQLPITTDYAAAKMFLNAASTDVINNQGTAIGAAIELASESFNYDTPSEKLILIISDGETHEGEATKQAQKAAEKGIKIFTIGIGSEAGAPIPIYRGGMAIGHKRDKDGKTVITAMNPDMLKEIAFSADGEFINASNGRVNVSNIINDVNQLDKAEFEAVQYTSFEDRFQYPLFLGMMLLLLGWIIPNAQTAALRKLKIVSSDE